MAEVKKTKFTINKAINPFGETKGKSPPMWLNFAPKEAKKISTIDVKRTMMLDQRKWKKKDIEDGCYAVARYELALFATQLAGIEKSLLKKANIHLKAKYKKVDDIINGKEVDKDAGLKKAFEEAGKDTVKIYGQLTKKLADKISIALDEVESDKGDNSKSLASCKDALRKFNGIKSNDLFQVPMTMVIATLQQQAKLARMTDKEKQGVDLAKEHDKAKKAVREAESKFESASKDAKSAAEGLLDTGAKMAKDTGADPKLQNLGKAIADKGPVFSTLKALIGNIDSVNKKKDEAVNLILKGDVPAHSASKLAKEFEAHLSKCTSLMSKAESEIAGIEKKYKAVEKDLKK